MNATLDIFRQTFAPASEPVPMLDAHEHVRLHNGGYNDIIHNLLVGARQYAEAFTRRQLVTATWQLAAFDFPCGVDLLRLRHGPVQSITSFQYIDPSGTTQTLDADDYTAVLDPEGAYVVPAYGTTWPTARCHPESVLITYISGYGTPAQVPQAIKQAMLLHVGHFFAHPEGEEPLPAAIDAMLWPFREMGGA